MTLSNYPDGVTGNEYEIAGPDDEWESEHYCAKCERTTTFNCESFRKQRSGVCSECNSDIDLGHADDDIDWDWIADQKEDFEHWERERGY